jgi:hypothetical protein
MERVHPAMAIGLDAEWHSGRRSETPHPADQWSAAVITLVREADPGDLADQTER